MHFADHFDNFVQNFGVGHSIFLGFNDGDAPGLGSACGMAFVVE